MFPLRGGFATVRTGEISLAELVFVGTGNDRPSGRLHIGHYHGVLENWVRMQDSFDCFFFVADWHSLTTEYADTSSSPQGK